MPNLVDIISQIQSCKQQEESKYVSRHSSKIARALKEDILQYVENNDSSVRRISYEINDGDLELKSSTEIFLDICNYAMYTAVSEYLRGEGFLVSGSWNPSSKSGCITIKW